MRHVTRALFFSVAVVLAVAVNMSVAQAHQYKVTVRNLLTDYPVWVTIYWKYSLSPNWTIERAFCLQPKSTWSGSVGFNQPALGPYLKFRGEMKNEKDCRGGNVADVEKSGAQMVWPDADYKADINGRGWNLNW